MNLQTVFVPKLAAFLAIIALFTTLGAAPSAIAQTLPQQPGNIYAVADLAPEGAVPGESDAGSSATFESTAAVVTRVTVVLLNVHSNSQYAVDIRDGSCSGAVLHGLSPIASDGSGSGTSVSDVPAGVEFGRWHVAVRMLGDKSGAALLCGQVNPALAGPPVSTSPGMPRTGQAVDLHVPTILWTGGATLLLGLVLRSRLVHRH